MRPLSSPLSACPRAAPVCSNPPHALSIGHGMGLASHPSGDILMASHQDQRVGATSHPQLYVVASNAGTYQQTTLYLAGSGQHIPNYLVVYQGHIYSLGLGLTLVDLQTAKSSNFLSAVLSTLKWWQRHRLGRPTPTSK